MGTPPKEFPRRGMNLGSLHLSQSCVCQVLQNRMSHWFRPLGHSRPVADIARLCLVIPPEPPVANSTSPQRRAAGKGAPVFGAA
jgi:hypothetical protein